MATAVLTGFSVEASQPGPTSILTGFEVFAASDLNAKAVLTGFQVFGTAAGPTAVLTGFEAYGTNTAVTAVLSAPPTAEPGETIALSLETSSGSPDAWVFAQTAGPAVDLVGSGATRTLAVPILLPVVGDTPIIATFTGTVSAGGGTPSVATVSIQFFPHTRWRRSPVAPFTPIPILTPAGPGGAYSDTYSDTF